MKAALCEQEVDHRNAGKETNTRDIWHHTGLFHIVLFTSVVDTLSSSCLFSVLGVCSETYSAMAS